MQIDPQAFARVKDYARPRYYYKGVLDALSTIYKQEGIQVSWVEWNFVWVKFFDVLHSFVFSQKRLVLRRMTGGEFGGDA